MKNTRKVVYTHSQIYSACGDASHEASLSQQLDALPPSLSQTCRPIRASSFRGSTNIMIRVIYKRMRLLLYWRMRHSSWKKVGGAGHCYEIHLPLVRFAPFAAPSEPGRLFVFSERSPSSCCDHAPPAEDSETARERTNTHSSPDLARRCSLFTCTHSLTREAECSMYCLCGQDSSTEGSGV